MDERFEKGLALRKQVLGESQVAGRVSQAEGTITAGLQQHLTAFVWGDVWSGTGLPLRERSMITVAMLTALKSEVELRTHLKAALRNGVTPAEIQEILLHSAAYCGFPSAMSAFRIARDVLAEAQAAHAVESRDG
jgi:4-carboxymuconolactone decarboxylase